MELALSGDEEAEGEAEAERDSAGETTGGESRAACVETEGETDGETDGEMVGETVGSAALVRWVSETKVRAKKKMSDGLIFGGCGGSQGGEEEMRG